MSSKSTGFMDIRRQDPGYRPRMERIRDWRAVERQLGVDEIQDQSARCMDCGTPFCHAFGCPVANIIPEINEAVYRGQWKKALELLLSRNNFPEFTGRVCPAPCEAACVAGLHWDPVAIRQIELTVIEKGFENGMLNAPIDREPLSGRVAVIGAGPAGLAVADTLNQAGSRVTVFDQAEHPGGLLRYGIPDFKLEKWVVERRVSLMKRQGVIFENNVTVGEDISFRFLKERFDAICLACGSREPRDLTVPGRELKGIHFAMDFLTQQNKRIGGEPLDPADEITATGKTVVVIGGGDTGSDCLGTALRQGAAKVHQMEILPKPPRDRDPSTPWPRWPLKLRKSHAHEEGGEQRWSVMTKAFEGKGGAVSGLRCCEVDWKMDTKGRMVPVERKGTEFDVKADLVLLAMGFTGPEANCMLDELHVGSENRGPIQVNKTNQTSIKGLFAAGDMGLGQSLVVRAIADGRRAAFGIREFLESGC